MANAETKIFCRLDDVTPKVREQKRLAALKKLGLLEAETTAVFDEATQTAARLLEAPICILGVMTPTHLQIKSAIGLFRVGIMNQLAQSRLLARSESFCSYVVDSHQVLAIHDTATHPVFASSVLVGHYGIRAYLGAPLLTADGLCLGTLAVMDWEPRSFSAKDIDFLAITARWSMREYEHSRLLQQNHTNPAPTSSQLPVGSPYLEGWESEPKAQRQDVSKACSVCINGTNFLKIQLLAQLTQELRTPLTSVMGMTSVLNRQLYGPLTSKQKEYVEIIHSSGQQLVSLVDEITDLTIFDESREQLQLTSVDIEMLCQQAINNLLDMAQSQQLEIRISVAPGNRICFLDKDKVRQILYYLVYGVIHSANPGGEVRLHASRKSDKLNIAVWAAHPWLEESLPQLSEEFVEASFPSSVIAPGTPAKSIAAVSQALETEPSNDTLEGSELTMSSCLPLENPVLSGMPLPVALSSNQEPNKVTGKHRSRDSLGLLLSYHLAELHGGVISTQGSLEAGYRYVVSLPLLESVQERL